MESYIGLGIDVGGTNTDGDSMLIERQMIARAMGNHKIFSKDVRVTE